MSRKQKKPKMNINRLSMILAILVIIVGLLIVFPLIFDGKNDSDENTIEPIHGKPEQAVSLTISCVGDVMVHRPQIPAQYDNIVDSYNFDNNFEFVKKYIEKSDLALCNLETTFAGGQYTGYPVFNSPESLADSLKKAGFDVALTANNHIMDMGLDGMKRTLEISRAAGLVTAGTQLEGEKNYTILDVKGVKTGIVAFGYETDSINGWTTINSNIVPDEAIPLLNTFNYETLDEDLLRIQEAIIGARNDGAELVICYFHWGEEYQRSPNDWQMYIARQAAAYSADIIFASHPHVLQGMEFITDQASGRKVPVFYSMGNFISNQRTETLDNRYTEQGIIAEVHLEFMKSTKQILGIQMGVIPTWVDKFKSGGKDVYTIIPLDSDFLNNPILSVSGHLPRAQQALDDIKQLLGEDNIKDKEHFR